MTKKQKPKKASNEFVISPMLGFINQIHRNRTHSDIESFKIYIKDNDSGIKINQKNLKEEIEKEIKKNPENGQDIMEWYEDDYNRHHHFNPNIFYNSTFLTLYSYLEINLKRICRDLHLYNKYNIGLDDLSGGNYIDKSNKFLKLVVGLNLEDQEENWRKIQKFQRIRNLITHNNSDIRIKPKKDINKQPHYQIIKAERNLQLDEKRGTFIIAENTFLLDFCDVIEDYILSILSKIAVRVNSKNTH